jgi:translation initiation factor IF-3
VTERNFRVNRQIRVPQVRLIDHNGEQVGIVNDR